MPGEGRLDRDLGGLAVADLATITTSGSDRKIDRSAVANVSPAFWLICT